MLEKAKTLHNNVQHLAAHGGHFFDAMEHGYDYEGAYAEIHGFSKDDLRYVEAAESLRKHDLDSTFARFIKHLIYDEPHKSLWQNHSSLGIEKIFCGFDDGIGLAVLKEGSYYFNFQFFVWLFASGIEGAEGIVLRMSRKDVLRGLVDIGIIKPKSDNQLLHVFTVGEESHYYMRISEKVFEQNYGVTRRAIIC
jgi:hypothetical protein